MAKVKKNPKSENSIIVNWVSQNTDKLEQVKTVNPDLFSAVSLALDYLNKSFGGSGQVMPESLLEISKTNQPPKKSFPIWKKEDFIGKRIVTKNESESRAFLKFIFELGINWIDDTQIIQRTYRKNFFIIEEGGWAKVYTDDSQDINDDFKSEDTILFEQLGIEPITEFLSKDEFENTSFYVDHITYRELEEILQLKYGLTKNSDKLGKTNSLTRGFYVTVYMNETFSKQLYNERDVVFDISNFGLESRYKSPDVSDGVLKFNDGDRFILEPRNVSGYVYKQTENGLKTLDLRIVRGSTTKVIANGVQNDMFSRNVEWYDDSNSAQLLSDFRRNVYDNKFLILTKKPLFKEGSKFETVEILNLGYLELENTFVYQLYRKDIDSFTSMTEENLVKYFNHIEANAPQTETPREQKFKFKAGDKVKFPETQDKGILGWSALELIREAKAKGQDYLIVTETPSQVRQVEYVELGVDDVYSLRSTWFMSEEVEPYVSVVPNQTNSESTEGNLIEPYKSFNDKIIDIDWGKSYPTNIDFKQAIDIINKKRRTESEKVNLTLFLMNVNYLIKGSVEYEKFRETYSGSQPYFKGGAYRASIKNQYAPTLWNIDTIYFFSEKSLEDWIVEEPFKALLDGCINNPDDKKDLIENIISVAVEEFGQQKVDIKLRESWQGVNKQTHESKPDVQDLYGELDDLDI